MAGELIWRNMISMYIMIISMSMNMSIRTTRCLWKGMKGIKVIWSIIA